MRILAILRVPKAEFFWKVWSDFQEMAIYKFRGFEFDGEVLKEDGKPKDVSKAGVRILHLLVLRRGSVVSHEDLARHGWDVGRTRENVNKEIATLRKELGDQESKEVICTAHGKGYKFSILQPELESTGEETQIDPATHQVKESPIRLAKPFFLLTRREFAFGDDKIDPFKWAREAREIDLLGTVLNSWFKHWEFVRILEGRLKEQDGLALRIILPDPESAFFRQFVEDQRKEPGDDPFIRGLKRKHARSIRRAAQLSEAAGKQVHRLAHETICSGIVRFDQVIKVSAQTYPFLQGKEATLLIEQQAQPKNKQEQITNEIFKMYKESFDRLWNKHLM